MKSKLVIYIFIIFVSLLSLVILYLTAGPSMYGRTTAPKLSGVTYKETRFNRQTMCFFICQYSPKYNYFGTGSQKEIANTIINDMKKQDVELRQNEENTGYVIDCYGNVGDRYQFRYKSASQNDYSSDFRVTFYANKQPGDAGSREVGCGRTDRAYRIEIDGVRNYWLSFG